MGSESYKDFLLRNFFYHYQVMNSIIIAIHILLLHTYSHRSFNFIFIFYWNTVVSGYSEKKVFKKNCAVFLYYFNSIPCPSNISKVVNKLLFWLSFYLRPFADKNTKNKYFITTLVKVKSQKNELAFSGKQSAFHNSNGWRISVFFISI